MGSIMFILTGLIGSELINVKMSICEILAKRGVNYKLVSFKQANDSITVWDLKEKAPAEIETKEVVVPSVTETTKNPKGLLKDLSTKMPGIIFSMAPVEPTVAFLNGKEMN